MYFNIYCCKKHNFIFFIIVNLFYKFVYFNTNKNIYSNKM